LLGAGFDGVAHDAAGVGVARPVEASGFGVEHGFGAALAGLDAGVVARVGAEVVAVDGQADAGFFVVEQAGKFAAFCLGPAADILRPPAARGAEAEDLLGGASGVDGERDWRGRGKRERGRCY